MSKSELAATWRSLDPATQRSYMLVAVKKSEACMKGKRSLGSAERYMVLLRYIFELLVGDPSGHSTDRLTNT